MFICKLYTKNNRYSVYKLIFNSSKPWVGGSNPSWITTNKEFFYSNHWRRGYLEGNKLNQKLLKHMGCSNYGQWKTMLSGKIQYTL